MDNTQEGGALMRAKFFSRARETLFTGGKYYKKIVGVIFIILLLVGGMLYVFNKNAPATLEDVYTLVPEKISASAPIAVMLPSEVVFAEFDPATAITFSPTIKGKWDASPSASSQKVYRFLPEEKMRDGAYYRATLSTPELKLEKMFSIAADPKVIALFPKEEVEANEYGAITLMFNRPMVPLSTLSENADITPPVVITPKTDGRWKWITTRTLQFTPTTHLVRSSRYSVSVGEGLYSTDGVLVPKFVGQFTTRTLHYLGEGAGMSTLTHDRPLRVYFNQPIDLEKTRAEITLTRTSGLVHVPFTVSYGTRTVYDEKKTRELTDQSVLEIYPVADRNGRKFLWDFEESYVLTIARAIPLEGDVATPAPRTENFSISPIIENVTALSERSNMVTPQLFDPTGTLEFDMSEPIDLTRSKISGKGIASIVYGKKCAPTMLGGEVDATDCAKVDDQKHIIVHFHAEEFGKGETSSIVFEKLTNTLGVVLNTSPITSPLTTYPTFTVIRTSPTDGATNGSLTDITLCTSVPLVAPSDELFYKKIRSNMMLGKWNWDPSYLVEQTSGEQKNICPAQTYRTTIRYGLVPKYSYVLTMDLEDPFGQVGSAIVHFTTKDADPLAKGFSHLQPTVVMTSPAKTTFSYGLDFMNEMDMTICKVSPETMLHYRVFTPASTLGASALNCTETVTKHLTLPVSYATRKYLTVDIHDYFPETMGNYVLVFSNPGYYRVSQKWDSKINAYVATKGEQLYEKTFVTVTRLALGAEEAVRRSDPNEGSEEDVLMNEKWPSNIYWVNDYATLAPSVGATLTPYREDGESIAALQTVSTDKDGIAVSASAVGVVGAIARVGDDSAIVSRDSDRLSYASSVYPSSRDYVYTDRPIYRPGDTVHIKGITRIGYDAEFAIPTGSSTVSIRDATYNNVENIPVHLNKNGTYEATFTLDTKAALGYYSLSSERGGYGSFQVEEYVAPQFKVAVMGDKEEYLSGDTARVNVSADYYFGVPVAKGNASYRIVAQDYYFDRYTDGYFQFGSGWYNDDNGWYGDKYVTGGTLTLDEGGKGTIAQTLSLDKLFTGNYTKGSKVFTVYVTVKNENGQSVTTEHSFIVHRGEFYAGLSMDDYFAVEGKSTTVHIKTVDTKGAPRTTSNLTISLSRIEWKNYKRQEVDGNFYYRSERVSVPVTTETIDTDRNGNADYPFTAPKSGEYEFTLTGKDGKGNTVSTSYALYVGGPTSVSVRENNNATLELVAPQKNLSVGDTASFVIKSPYPKARALVSIVRGHTFEYKVLSLDTQLLKYSFPVTERYIPNVTAGVLLLSPLPEIKYGEVNYTVGTKEKDLSIAITPGKKSYLPGEKVDLDLVVTDKSGRPVNAELSLAVVDMSVLALVGNPKKNPVAFFYRGEPVTIQTSMNVKNILHVAEIPVGTKGGSGGDDLEKKKRGVFRDTAYWNGVVETDTLGRAHVSFTLPDNLTQWQVESVGVTEDTKVGVGYADFTARKSIMALPIKPRFIIPGDTLSIGGTVFNETEKTQTLVVSVTSPKLELTGVHEMSIAIAPHTSLSVSFPARAPEGVVGGVHEFTLSAKNSDFEDVVSSSFPVEQNNTYEFAATAGRITDPSWKEQIYIPKGIVPQRGGLTLSLSATMASMLDSAIQSMIIYPYECSEQVGAKLRTIALAKEYAHLFGTTTPLLPESVTIDGSTYTIDQLVLRGLAKLSQATDAGGGMPFYANLPPDFDLSLATLETYNDLVRAGYTVDKEKREELAHYVVTYVNTHTEQSKFSPISSDDVIRTAYILRQLPESSKWKYGISSERIRGYARNSALTHTMSTPSLAALTILSVEDKLGADIEKRLFAEFENRSTIDARGTVITNQNTNVYFGDNAIRNTALAVKAFAESQYDSPLLEGYLRTLKNTKAHDGGWGSTYNSITVIDAMTSYLTWKKEAEAHMTVTAALGGTTLLSHEFKPGNLLSSIGASVPMTQLAQGKMETLTFEKKDNAQTESAYYYDLLLHYYLPADHISPRDEGFSVRRELYKQSDTTFSTPITRATQGDVIHGRVIISVPTMRTHVSIEDFIPAGTEIVNQHFATEDQGLGENDTPEPPPTGDEYGYDAPRARSFFGGSLAGLFGLGGAVAGPKTKTDGTLPDDAYGSKVTSRTQLYPTQLESHDDRLFAYIDTLPPGEYVYDYYLRALVPGTYQYLPLIVSELYTPENFGRTAGSIFTVDKKN
jgi:uncharacterized protein YfaS (alpha-2-macroglobulin family)